MVEKCKIPRDILPEQNAILNINSTISIVALTLISRIIILGVIKTALHNPPNNMINRNKIYLHLTISFRFSTIVTANLFHSTAASIENVEVIVVLNIKIGIAGMNSYRFLTMQYTIKRTVKITYMLITFLIL